MGLASVTANLRDGGQMAIQISQSAGCHHLSPPPFKVVTEIPLKSTLSPLSPTVTTFSEHAYGKKRPGIVLVPIGKLFLVVEVVTVLVTALKLLRNFVTTL